MPEVLQGLAAVRTIPRTISNRMRAIFRILPPTTVIVLHFCACAVEAPALKEVLIVFKTHFDIGYTDLATNVVQRYRTTMIDQALEVAEKNRGLPPEQQFVWTIPGWPMKEILADWPGQSQERKQKIMRAFDEGRFVVHAWPFTTHTELLEPEDLVRGMSFSSKISRETGKPLPRDAKMTDVPSHSWILPTLLKHSGVDFLHLGCNPASSSPLVPLLFWWEGPDGSRLLTMYSAGDYGSRLVPPPSWPHKTWLALIMTGDNHGPPRPEEVSKLMAEARDKLPGVKVRVGRLSDFSDALLAEKPELPVVRGDMADTWIYGPMSDPQGAGIARNTRPAIATAELLATELRAWGAPGPDSPADVAQAYEQSLLYGEHTWGGAFRWIYGRYNLKYGQAWQQDRDAGKFRRIESSWDEHTAYILKARSLIAPLLNAELEHLAKAVNVSGPRVVVFNPLPWRRTGIVAMPTQPGQKSLSSQAADGMFSFIAADIPSGGYKTFELDQLQSTGQMPFGVTNDVLQNEYFKVTLDPERGKMSSIVEKKSGREWVDSSAPQGFGQYLYERFHRTQVDAFVKA